MRKLSIKMRVTLWFTLLMIILVILMYWFMQFISKTLVEKDAKETLVQIVDQNMDEVELDDGEFEIDDDFVYVYNGVYSVIYKNDGTTLSGLFPSGVTTDEAFHEGEVREISVEGEKYFLYDRMVNLLGMETMWVRGVIMANSNAGITNSLLQIVLIALLFLVLCAALGGYRIAKWSFEPIEQINRAANEISDGKDLSKRIDLGEGEDEIHRLAKTFNHMFCRLETSFDGEKQFVADASHELRTPTTVILAQCDFALEYVETPEEYRESLEVIDRQAKRMSHIIGELLTVTRLDRGIEKANFENIDLSEFIVLLCEEYRNNPDQNIAFSYDIEPDIHANVDCNMINRLLVNLISNAYQYGKEDGWIRLELRQRNGTITLSVRDNGIGIAKEDQEKIWRRFYQANTSRSGNGNGSTGLGLSMVKQIAQIHGGDVLVESELGKGSTFTFTFPNDFKAAA